MIPDDTNILTLNDGRQLAYTEHGDLDGAPVFFFHGNPGSRYMRHPDENIATALGLRIITPDRPGFGLSDFQPLRQLVDYASDIRELADHLQVDQFRTFGVSAGGPYVAACAYALPNRLSVATIVSGAAPMNRPKALRGVNSAYQAVFRMSSQLPYVALRPLVEAHVQLALLQPHKLWFQRMHIASKADRYVLEELGINDEIDNYYHEAARNGARGIAWEAKLLATGWGFQLADIRVPVNLWYWEDDHIVPLQMGEYLSANIPASNAHFLPGGGHYAIFEHWEAILQELVTNEFLAI